MDQDPILAATLTKLAGLPALRSMAAVEHAWFFLEEQALRAALEACGWLPARAARYLGCPQASSMTRILARHPDLAEEVARRRLAANTETR